MVGRIDSSMSDESLFMGHVGLVEQHPIGEQLASVNIVFCSLMLIDTNTFILCRL